ncbi:MAG TPA: HAD family phosphatase [Nitrospiraceae bacterium]|nr:HAD family phosphatase [Nitrospiraceae bacterium]
MSVRDNTAVEAVVFDLDGVIIDSEQIWNRVRESLVRERGGRWHSHAHRDMMGMSAPEWSRYMHDVLGLSDSPQDISTEVVRRMEEMYRHELPLMKGAVQAVDRLTGCWPLAVASSSNRQLIDLILEIAGLARRFAATVSSEEVPRGKPAPDVYLEAARRLHMDSAYCVAIEDSQNGFLSARAAGMRVIAIPNRHYPPDRNALAVVSTVLDSLDELTLEVVKRG